MRHFRVPFIGIAIFIFFFCDMKKEGQTAKPRYPATRKGPVVDTLHAVPVSDPYRWLEEIDNRETREWINAQNKLSQKFLERIPQRQKIEDRFRALWHYERYGHPQKRGGRYFYTYNDGLMDQSVLYWMKSLKDRPVLLLDPNRLSKDGTIALTGWSVSENGRYLAYGLSSSGSDWQEWLVKDIDQDSKLSDHLQWVKFSGAAWTIDHQGFFYCRYKQPEKGKALKALNYYQKLYYHRLGTPQSRDTLIYERSDKKEWGFGPEITEDGRYLVITVWKGTLPENAIFYRDLSRKNGKIIELLNAWDADYRFIGNDGPLFYFRTDLNAPMSRVIAIDINRPGRPYWREIIPESKHAIKSVSLVDDKFLVTCLVHAQSRIKVFSKKGKYLKEVKLPDIGSTWGFSGRQKDKEAFYQFTNFTTPGILYRYDMQTGKSTIFKKPEVDFNPSSYKTTQVFYNSKDGIRIPMFLCHKKGLKKTTAHPVLLYGYGGFNIPLTPFFSVSNLVFMERGGIYVQACVRGGGEYGKAWHDAGRRLNKQNVFDDFIAAGEWLVENKYTKPSRLAIAGGSNGGLLVGACMTRRPGLFGACLISAGVLDMLRFHKFTIGWAWTSDYGSPDSLEQFKALLKYSPYHNIKPGTSYPPTLITTGDHDDRVFPAHSFKFAARLQAAQSGPGLVLINIETRAGHGRGKPTSMKIEEAADKLAFLVKSLNIE